MFSHLGEVNQVQNTVPSHMKCIFASGIKADSSLKVKRRTLVITSCETSSNSKEKINENGQASSHPIIVWKVDDLDVETRSTEVP